MTLLREEGFEQVRFRLLGGSIVALHVGTHVSALATVRAAEGLSDYLEAVEERLGAVVRAHPGIVASVSSDALCSAASGSGPP